MNTTTEKTFLPGAGHDWLLPLYDPLVKLFGGDRARGMLLEHADLRAGHRVLDIGCGTGTLLARITRTFPGVEATGIDPDPRALSRARRKIESTGATVRLDRAFADALPYPDATFERVFSSIMLHHLKEGDKAAAVREVRRVLVPGGSFHLVDFVPRPGSGGRHGIHRLQSNSEDRILALLGDAGLTGAEVVGRGAMFFGHLPYASYIARAAPAAG